MNQAKWLRSALFLSASSMVFYSCNKEIQTQDKKDSREGVEVLAKKNHEIKFSGRYILLAKSSTSLPAGLDAAVNAAGGSIVRKMNAIGEAIVTSRNPDFIAKASAIPGVRSVIHGVTLNWIPKDENSGQEASGEAGPVLTPGDTRYPLQWNMPAIDADQAWHKGYMGKGALVAVLDGGFFPEHVDINDNVNMALSKNFVEGETINMTPGEFSHGTHVAGIVAAELNGFGTVGVAPQASLMLVKVISNDGGGSFEDIISGIYYAAINGADVINMSLGGFIPHHFQERLEDGTIINYTAEYQELLVAMNRATVHATQMGTLIVASAGNELINLQKIADYDHYPSGCTNVLTVSATSPIGWAKDMNTNLDVPTSYTNYGTSSIHFAAPGGDLYPAVTGNCTVGGLTLPCFVFDLIISPAASNNGYFFAAGTSMAAPHVAGVAALVVGKHPGYSPSQIEAILKASADDLGKPGRDAYFGYGRVNASKAVDK